MKGNLGTIIYLVFRLAPVIILVFFIINYFLYYDVLIIYYFIGMFIACFCTIFASNLFPSLKNRYEETDNSCSLFDLTTNGPISTLPLSQVVLCFTFYYIGYILFKYGLLKQNLPILILLPILIVGDMTWNAVTKCNNSGSVFVAFCIGSGFGILWAYIIESTTKKDLSKFIGLNRKKDNCYMVNNKYKCT